VSPGAAIGAIILVTKEPLVNWDQIEGRWKQAKGAVKQRWGRLTDDDLDIINGQRDQLVGRIQERYGTTRENAEREIESWLVADQETADERERKAS
jgi:uncharacterized protein YjbJ (UPF0337 family)